MPVPPTPEDYYPAMATQLLSQADPGGLWVFASGSLIWNPRMPVAERRAALVHGWHRSFCLGPMLRFRGSPQAPGLMLSLDRGGSCRGIALRMTPGNEHADLVSLLQKEPPRPPSWVRAKTAQGVVRAIAFTMDRGWSAYCPESCLDTVADMLASSVGTVGSMADYLLNTVEHLAAEGIHDSHLWRLQEMVAARLEQLPDRAVAQPSTENTGAI